MPNLISSRAFSRVGLDSMEFSSALHENEVKMPALNGSKWLYRVSIGKVEEMLDLGNCKAFSL